MVSIAIKLLSVVAGIWAAFASYPYLNLHVVAILAVVAAIAVGILSGVLVWYLLSWIFGEISKQRP
jgi:phage shock protein PspC (stress-responsive transcriptional regulator)